MLTEPMHTETQVIKVDILLAGGHRYRVNFTVDDPLLLGLVQTIASNGQPLDPSIPQLFQLPLEQGRAALYFSGQQLVGLATDPALDLLQLDIVDEADELVPNASMTDESVTDEPVTEESGTDTPNAEILPSPVVQLDDFFADSEQQALLEHVIAKENKFVPTTTSTQATSYRESKILPELGPFRDLIIQRIHQVMPTVCQQLNLPAFQISEIESQLTVHNDGNYYKIHNDNGSPETATRELTYVYYFYQEPKAFSGGELLVYDSKVENNFYVAADSFQTVEPRNNSIVFFLSRYMHEVLPIRCPSQQFGDGRFTINGWVRRS